jgi:hypothetical protein
LSVANEDCPSAYACYNNVLKELLKLLRKVNETYILDTTTGFFLSTADENMVQEDTLHHLAQTGERVQVLSESDYRTILSLLPKGCGVPTVYDGRGNPKRAIQRMIEHYQETLTFQGVGLEVLNSQFENISKILKTLSSGKPQGLQ